MFSFRLDNVSTTLYVQHGNLSFPQVLHGVTGEPERWKLCVSYANDNMGFAVGRLFVENHFNDNSKQKVNIS